MAADRLDRDAWIDAGLDALEQGGVAAIAVVPLARALGVTRGSFYWHFASREELLAAVVARWERDHGDAVLDALEQLADPRARLTELLTRAVTKQPSFFIALLDAADAEPLVAAALERTAERRRATIARACRQLGMTPAAARHHARLCYAAYVGLAHDARGARGESPARREAFARHVVAALVPGG